MQPNPYGQPEFSQNPFVQHPLGLQSDLPNVGAVLALGIVSIVLFFLGPLLGTIALIIGRTPGRLYSTNPLAYTQSSYRTLKSGRTCAIIGLCVGTFVWLIYIAWIIYWYIMIMSIQEAMEESLQTMPQ